jgi:hypothetical protein
LTYIYRLYIHGGQDLKEGCFGDMWKLGIDFLYNGSAEVDKGIADGAEIEGVSWTQINLGGKYPARLAHH